MGCRGSHLDVDADQETQARPSDRERPKKQSSKVSQDESTAGEQQGFENEAEMHFEAHKIPDGTLGLKVVNVSVKSNDELESPVAVAGMSEGYQLIGRPHGGLACGAPRVNLASRFASSLTRAAKVLKAHPPLYVFAESDFVAKEDVLKSAEEVHKLAQRHVAEANKRLGITTQTVAHADDTLLNELRPQLMPALHSYKFNFQGEVGEASRSLQLRSRDMRVLIVDDVRVTRLVTSRALRMSGMQVTAVASGSEGLEKAAEKKFHLVLMDVQMPDMSGTDATRELRRRGSNAVILGLTSSCQDEELRDYRRAGMDGCIEKGSVVSHAVQEALARLDEGDRFVFVDAHNEARNLVDDTLARKLAEEIEKPEVDAEAATVANRPSRVRSGSVITVTSRSPLLQREGEIAASNDAKAAAARIANLEISDFGQVDLPGYDAEQRAILDLKHHRRDPRLSEYRRHRKKEHALSKSLDGVSRASESKSREVSRSRELSSSMPQGIMPKQRTKTRVLMVDDVGMTRTITQRAVARCGLLCDVAASGDEAIRLYQNSPYSIILMDVNLPGMKGTEATTSIREYEHSHLLPSAIIYGLTGDCSKAALSRCNAAGMNGCIEKGCILSRAMLEARAITLENPTSFVFINAANVHRIVAGSNAPTSVKTSSVQGEEPRESKSSASRSRSTRHQYLRQFTAESKNHSDESISATEDIPKRIPEHVHSVTGAADPQTRERQDIPPVHVQAKHSTHKLTALNSEKLRAPSHDVQRRGERP
ncbi:MAG: hypothetical protein MHM6MM_001047 [Cercozoa sp. M6MM]